MRMFSSRKLYLNDVIVFAIINFNCEGMGPPTIWREMILMYFATNMLESIMVLRKRDS